MPVLTALKKFDLLDNPTLDIVGGECTEYKDGQLKEIIDFALENDCWMQFFSSGILYSEDIARALNYSKANLCVSVDSGNKDTYEKIKRVHAYERVWENLKNYSLSCVKNPNTDKGYLILKYIIIPGINDNISELNKFFEKANSIGCTWIRIVIEYNWWAKNCNLPIPQNIWNLIDFIEAKKSMFRIEYIENATYLLQKRLSEDKN